MDFTTNLSQIAGKLAADLREKREKGGGEQSQDDPQGIYSVRLSLSFHRVLPFQNNPQPLFNPPHEPLRSFAVSNVLMGRNLPRRSWPCP